MLFRGYGGIPALHSAIVFRDDRFSLVECDPDEVDEHRGERAQRNAKDRLTHLGQFSGIPERVACDCGSYSSELSLPVLSQSFPAGGIRSEVAFAMGWLNRVRRGSAFCAASYSGQQL
jgi:hypothetical protein